MTQIALIILGYSAGAVIVGGIARVVTPRGFSEVGEMMCVFWPITLLGLFGHSLGKAANLTGEAIIRSPKWLADRRQAKQARQSLPRATVIKDSK